MKKVISAVAALTTMFLSTSVFAENIGVCTHMAHSHRGNTIPGVLDKVSELETDYIRDEIRWGWGMQPSATAPLQMPTAYWVDDAEAAEVDSLVILGLGNSAFDVNEAIPKVDDAEYFNAFLDYVRFVVKTCKGKVEAYEIWNEPNHGPFNYYIANGLSYEPSDYVELVKAVSEVIEDEDEDAKIVGGAHLLGGTQDSGWMEGLFEAGIGNYIDAFSIHIYTHGKCPEREMADCYDRVEKIMDNYGFNGEVWLTETGYSTASSSNNSTEEEQAAYAIRTKILWDNYLKTNGRNGEFFWYELRNSGTDAAEREGNFGIIDYKYNKKPSFNSIKLYNELLDDRDFDSLTSSGSYLTFKNEAKYKDGITGDFTHILYRGKYTSGSKIVPLSGNVAYLYDYQGNIVRTYTNTNQSITVTLAENPQIVHCVSYKSSIESLEYDADKNVCTIFGKTNIPNEELTITLFENGEEVQKETAKVKDGEFKIQFSPAKDGEYVLSAGKEEIEALDSEFYAEKELSVKRNAIVKEAEIECGISVEYNEKTMTVTVSGKLMDLKTNENTDGVINALVLKEETDINTAGVSDVIFMDDVKTENGEFSLSFKINDADSSKYRLYLKNAASQREDSGFGNAESGKFIYTFDFSKDEENLLVEASLVSSDAQKAVMIISQYDASGRLLEVKTQDITANSGEASMKASKNASAVSYRAYMWDSLTGMKPIVPMTEIK